MEEDNDPKVEVALLVEPVDVLMVDIVDDFDTMEVKVSYEDHMRVVFPKAIKRNYWFSEHV